MAGSTMACIEALLKRPTLRQIAKTSAMAFRVQTLKQAISIGLGQFAHFNPPQVATYCKFYNNKVSLLLNRAESYICNP